MSQAKDLTMKKALPASRRSVVSAALVLAIFYLVGFVGLGFSSHRPLFQALVPFNLLLTNAVLFSFHRGFTKPFGVFAAVVAGSGFLAEVLGVHTGVLFGSYQYGSTLGLKLWKVPLLIGLNWLMLVYTTGHLSDLFRLPWPLKALLATGLMVGLDYFLEPVAVQLGFWSWQGGQIPLSNFIGWFGVALLMQLYYQQADFPKVNPLAPLVFGLQLLFFAGLYLVLG